MSKGTDCPLRIITPLSGDMHVKFLRMWADSLERVMPKGNPMFYRYDRETIPDLLKFPACLGDRIKAVLTSHWRKSLVTDVDCLFLRQFDYEPPTPETVLAMPVKWMLPGTTEQGEPDEWGGRVLWALHEKLGMMDVEPLTVLTWAIWARTNLLPMFDEEVPRIAKLLQTIENGDRFCLTVAVWHIIWHRLRREGKADILPNGYVLHLPVYPLPRRLEVMKLIWEQMCRADKSRA